MSTNTQSTPGNCASEKQELLVFISDGTGVSAETMGLAVMSQLGKSEDCAQETISFVNSPQALQEALESLAALQLKYNKLIIFSTLAACDLSEQLSLELEKRGIAHFNFFSLLLPQISKTLGKKIEPLVGQAHANKKELRAHAVDYALKFDDGQQKEYEEADIILLGLSRSGKTPTALWLALHYGLKAANYPITQDDFDKGILPEQITQNLHKCVLLVTSAQRLFEIRQERLKHSKYASLENCQSELRRLMSLPDMSKIATVDVSNKSVEEIAATSLKLTKIHPKMRF